MADRAGFEAFYRERLAQLVRACVLVTLDRAAAEDVAAEAFARLWPRWEQMQSADHAGGYVFKTAMRLCAKRGSRGRREIVGAPPERTGGDEMGRALERDEVFAALARIPLRQRQCVVLRDWAGFGTDEVASMLAMRESTVRVHLSRGRGALRKALMVEERNDA